MIKDTVQVQAQIQVPGSLSSRCGGGWTGGGGVISLCTVRGIACQGFPGVCCPIIFSR